MPSRSGTLSRVWHLTLALPLAGHAPFDRSRRQWMASCLGGNLGIDGHAGVFSRLFFFHLLSCAFYLSLSFVSLHLLLCLCLSLRLCLCLCFSLSLFLFLTLFVSACFCFSSSLSLSMSLSVSLIISLHLCRTLILFFVYFSSLLPVSIPVSPFLFVLPYSQFL